MIMLQELLMNVADICQQFAQKINESEQLRDRVSFLEAQNMSQIAQIEKLESDISSLKGNLLVGISSLHSSIERR